jgi:DNA invertase Pin-like site-specific DNA recombinase
MKTRVCIYARVSTQGQDYERQLSELREYAERMNYEVVREFSEKISGAKTIAERQALTDLLDFAATNHIDKVLVYECSRISRRAIDFLQVIEQLTQMKVSVYILQNGLETLNADKSVNALCQMVLGIIGQFNAVERSLLRSRMSSGYKVYRANGGKVGRKEGYRKSEEAMRTQYSKEMSLLRKGISLRNVQSITGTSVNTLRKLREMM